MAEMYYKRNIFRLIYVQRKDYVVLDIDIYEEYIDHRAAFFLSTGFRPGDARYREQ